MALDTSRYKYVLTGVDGSIPVGAGEVLKPDQRTYTEPLNGARTASLSLKLDNPRANFVINNDALLKVYRRDRVGSWHLRMVGDVLSTGEKAEGNSTNLMITASDGFWRLMKRLIGMAINSQNQGTGFTVGTASVPVDLATAVVNVLTAVNNDYYSGVQQGTFTLCGTTSVVGPLYAAFAGPTIQQICATLGGPDIWVDPIEPTGAMPNTEIGQLNVGPIRGNVKPLAIFDYGTGKKNVQSYDRLLTKQNVCNHAVALPLGWPTAINAGDTVVTNNDSASQAAISRFDDIASSDVASSQLRAILCQEEVQVRKQKQQIITFVPTVDNPVDFTLDYDVGDIVTARAFDVDTNTYRYNGTARVYGVGITVDENDSETISLTLVPGG